MRPASGILLVEDDPEDQSIFEDAIRSLQNSDPLHVEKNGVDALNTLNHLQREGSLPCIIVADLNMPKMSGTELLRKLKLDENLNHIPVIIYSTSINPVEKENCMRFGAYAYITKPLSYKESIEVAEMVLQLCQTVQQG